MMVQCSFARRCIGKVHGVSQLQFRSKNPGIGNEIQPAPVRPVGGCCLMDGMDQEGCVSIRSAISVIYPIPDFIFSVAGEELGFIGSAAILIVLFLIICECIRTGWKAKDLSGKLICCGVASIIAVQGFINICVATGIAPNTGTPLPFVSYGLSSMVSLYTGMGLVLNVGLQKNRDYREVGKL